MNEELRNTLVGVLMLAAIAALGVYTFADQRHKGTAGSGLLIHAAFNRVDGLNTGDAIRMSGVKVGEVAGMKLGPNYGAIVDLRIDTPVEIPADTSAAIHTDSLFSSKHIVLEPGADDEAVKPNGTLTLTQDSVVLSELLQLIINEGHANLAKLKAAAAGGGAPKPDDTSSGGPPTLLQDMKDPAQPAEGDSK